MLWTDRIESQSGDLPGNVFDFFSCVSAKLLVDLRKPFRLEGAIRHDATPLHDAVREALCDRLVDLAKHPKPQWPFVRKDLCDFVFWSSFRT